jgi:hypothetical protein
MFLRGAGAAVALPCLEAMPRGAESAVRMAVVYVPNGIIMKDWALDGKILEPVAKHRQKLIMISGLAQNGGRALGDGPGDHARAAASYLTGVHCRKTAGADIKNGISFDQIAAQHLAGQTRFPSLELGCEKTGFVGNCDSGYACAYTNNLSWRSETAPMPPEANPRLVFERLFGASSSPAERAYDQSILDLVREEATRLRGGLGNTDRRKLDEYLYSVREVERRLQSAEKAALEPGMEKPPGMERPSGIPVDYSEHARLMFDLAAIAFQTGLTRVATIMMGREGSNRTYREIGVTEAHHGLTHHKGDADKIERIARINRFHVEQLGYFLDKLASLADGDSNLLERSMVLYGAGISDGNRHDHHDLPTLLCGGGNGTLKGARHIKLAGETPATNLFLSMLHRMGVPAESVGDSTGKLELAGLGG